MLNLDEINKEILMLETTRDTTYAVIQRLAPLYIVRNNLMQTSVEREPKTTNVSTSGDSLFMQAVSGKDISKIMDIMNELVTTLEVINPNLYAAVMRKINDL